LSSAAVSELSTDTAVMAIGGFPGNDPVPTLNQVQDYVAHDRITYYIVPNSGNDPGPRGFGGQHHNDIADWVEAHFKPIRVESTTFYDLSSKP
jgi:hypothetical protein